MSTKYTLMGLCEEYNKIEVPIIQRDYAQGRLEQESVRNRFVDYLVGALANNQNVELDFVYGNVRNDVDKTKPNCILRTFIPIDGQQRLTTLWLLHWFLANKECRIKDISDNLKKFVYETRPSAHDFCRLIIEKPLPQNRECSIDKIIINQAWFDNEWLKDGTVKGMLQMLHTFESYPELLNGKIQLSQLLSPNDKISFYFVELKEFGLSEELYIRMNARGKILTEFENFKSEFYKIIKNNRQLDEVKNKIEYQWVDNLWDYRDNDYLVDNGFMNYLEFITKMLYFRKEKSRNEKGYASNFKDLKLLKEVYSISDNVEFFIKSFDLIPKIKSLKSAPIFWQGSNELTLKDLLEYVIYGKEQNIENQFSLYATILYLQNNKNETNLPYFIRVVRNIAINTNDKSEREWPRILQSLESFSKLDVILSVKSPNFNLIGFSNTQCKEEHFKSLLSTQLIKEAEDYQCFKGNISPLLAACYVDSAKEIDDICENFTLTDKQAKEFEYSKFNDIFNAYKQISLDGFNEVWGDLIITDIYYHDVDYGRLYYDRYYKKSGSMLAFAKKFAKTKLYNYTEFSSKIERDFVKEILRKYKDLSKVTNVKEQLYLLYIITRRINKKDSYAFFKNNYNFGWLPVEKGYSSLFSDGINDDPWFEDINPIFQTYDSQFRYNMGIKDYHAIDIEIGQEPKKYLFDKLIEWTNLSTN